MNTPLLLITIFFLNCIHGQLIALEWSDIQELNTVYLYAGDIPNMKEYNHYIGLSLTQNNANHIQFDITKNMLLPDNCVDIYQSEDVFEHIEYTDLPKIINEIFRVLKPGGLLRISVPDYRSDILYNRSLKDKNGNIIFDAGGGGKYINGKVVNGGHVWFPDFEKVNNLLQKTEFSHNGIINFLHFYKNNGTSITHSIDYSKGYINRTPDHDKRVQNPYRGLSLVVDLYKK